MSRYLASFPMASSTSWKKTNHQKNQQKATTDPTATARRSVADWKNSSGPKLEGQPRRSAAERKPKTSLFGTDSLQCSALGIHDHAQHRGVLARGRASAASLSTNGSAAQARSRR